MVIVMLSFLDKRIFHIHIGTYVAAILCFFSAYAENEKDNVYKNIYENGTNVNSTIIKKSKYCGGRGGNWLDVQI
jgi:hypothetical protein